MNSVVGKTTQASISESFRNGFNTAGKWLGHVVDETHKLMQSNQNAAYAIIVGANGIIFGIGSLIAYWMDKKALNPGHGKMSSFNKNVYIVFSGLLAGGAAAGANYALFNHLLKYPLSRNALIAIGVAHTTARFFCQLMAGKIGGPSLSDELKKATQAKAEAEKQAQANALELQRIQKELQRIQEEKKASESKNVELEKQVGKSQEDFKNTQNEILALKQQQAKLNASEIQKLKELQAKEIVLKQKLEEHDKEQKNINSQKHTIQLESEKLVSQHAKLEEGKKALENKKRDLEQREANLQSQLTELQKKEEAAKNAKLEKKQKEVETDKEKEKQRLETEEKEKLRLETEEKEKLRLETEEKEKQRKAAEEAQAQRKAIEEKREALKKETENLGTNLSQVKKTLEENETELKNLIEALELANQNKDQFKIDEISPKLFPIQEKIKELQIEKHNLEEKFQQEVLVFGDFNKNNPMTANVATT